MAINAGSGTSAPAAVRPVWARVCLGLVGVLWGLNWSATREALHGFSPWTLRAIGLSVGSLVLLGGARLLGRSLFVPPGRPRRQLLMASLLNIAGFNVLTAFAQLGTTTGRAAVCAYTMPIWATLLAWPILGERPDRGRLIALAVGVIGLAILLAPLVEHGPPSGVLYALGAAAVWAAGTVYLKRARIPASAAAIAGWQLAASVPVVLVGAIVSGGVPQIGTLAPLAVLGMAYNAIIGMALVYLLWFEVVTTLPAGTAGLGSLLVPVVGVVAAVVLLGERPTTADIAGFALIFAAAAIAIGARPRRSA